jgi:hypothetical protein
MARNRHFNQYTPVKQEQSLVEDLIIESIKIYGVDGYYLPRTHVNLDKIYGEDASVLFDDALEMELYVKSFDGFMGQEDFLAKFGLQVDESVTFVISQKRFTQSLKTSIITEYSYNMLTEDGDELLSNKNDVSEYDYDAIVRPREGDMIWIPMFASMYEIKFTQNIENFFQLGKLYTYELRCDRIEYSSEKLDTGVADIDALEDTYSLSTDNIEKLLDEVDSLIFALEDGTRLLAEGDLVIPFEIAADNEVIGEKIIEGDILDFSEQNPFALTRNY